MQQTNQVDKQSFLYPKRRYYGQVTPEALVFNANLQEFAQRVNYICNLQTRGKLSPQESYYKISDLWEQLKCSNAALEISSDAENETGVRNLR